MLLPIAEEYLDCSATSHRDKSAQQDKAMLASQSSLKRKYNPLSWVSFSKNK
jgi:hypothetical protein